VDVADPTRDLARLRRIGHQADANSLHLLDAVDARPREGDRAATYAATLSAMTSIFSICGSEKRTPVLGPRA
jgi:hypothetical protein